MPHFAQIRDSSGDIQDVPVVCVETRYRPVPEHFQNLQGLGFHKTLHFIVVLPDSVAVVQDSVFNEVKFLSLR